MGMGERTLLRMAPRFSEARGMGLDVREKNSVGPFLKKESLQVESAGRMELL